MDTIDQATLIRIVAFILVGAAGTFLLLPHQHGLVKPVIAHRSGYGLVGLAAVIFASFWTAPSELITRFFFYAFGFAAVLGGVFTVTNRNPIYSALWFASVVLATSGLFLLSGAQFLAAGTIIVYAGAIIVTFLFVIMLAQMEGRAIYDRTARSPFWATFSSFLLLFGLCYSLLNLKSQPETLLARGVMGSGGERVMTTSGRLLSATHRLTDMRSMSSDQRSVLGRSMPPTSALPGTAANVNPRAGAHVAALGAALYTEHLVTVELAGALLFVALIGALSIAAPKAPIRPQTSGPATGTTA